MIAKASHAPGGRVATPASWHAMAAVQPGAKGRQGAAPPSGVQWHGVGDGIHIPALQIPEFELCLNCA